MHGERWSVRPHLRDILEREHGAARPRDEALEKWGLEIEEEVRRDLERQRQVVRQQSKSATPAPPREDGPDLDRG
jgi:hypothetical protein